jgi:competence protein ComEC
VALGSQGPTAPASLLAIASALCGLAAVALRSRRPSLCGLLLLAAACGAGTALARLDRASCEVRARALVPGGAPVELHLRGELLSSPETGARGERLLLLRARAERAGALTGPVVRVQLVVAPSPHAVTRELDALGPGDTVRVWCRLFRPRGVANSASSADDDPAPLLAARGLDALGSVKSARLVERVREARWPSPVDELRRLARARLDVALAGAPAARALAGGMLLGDRQALDPRIWRDLRDAGLAHLVAISGLNVAMVGATALYVLRRLRLHPLARLAIVGVLLAGFGQLVGLRPSVVRALLGAAVVETGRALGRGGDSINTLVLLAVALVACAPPSLHDPGLLLTFLATAGLLLAMRGSTAREPWAGLRVSAAAYLATAPVTAWHFARLAPIALLTNLAAVPLCAAMLASGYAVIALGDLPLLGDFAGWLLHASTAALLAVARAGAAVDGGAFSVAPPAPWLVALYYAFGQAALRAPRDPRPCAAFAAACVLLHVGPPPPAPPELMAAAVLDVGQGQAVAVRGSRGGTVLVDAGGSAHPAFDPGERIVLPSLLRLAGRRVDTLVLSHEDVDHAGGAAVLLRDLEIGELCLPPGFHASERLSDLAALACERGASVRTCGRGDVLERGGLRAEVLSPARGRMPAAGNDGSVSLRFGGAPLRLLIPGDLERTGEEELLRATSDLRAEALVLGHHGSRTSTSDALLARVAPRIAIASCGHRNPFGHPHPAVCRRVRESGALLWRTDLDGQVRLEVRSGSVSVSAARR